MKREFIAVVCRKTAKRRAPWAAAIVKADGGFWTFESATDAATWRAQK